MPLDETATKYQQAVFLGARLTEKNTTTQTEIC